MKPIRWVGGSWDALKALPSEVRRNFGFAFHFAQIGTKHPAAKPLSGFGGAGVLEVVEDDSGGTYRAVYTVKFTEAVYVLHVFQKKSKRGIKTPLREIEIIRERLKWAERDHAEKRSIGGS